MSEKVSLSDQPMNLQVSSNVVCHVTSQTGQKSSRQLTCSKQRRNSWLSLGRTPVRIEDGGRWDSLDPLPWTNPQCWSFAKPLPNVYPTQPSSLVLFLRLSS